MGRTKAHQRVGGETFYVVPPTSLSASAQSSRLCTFCFKYEKENCNNENKNKMKFVQRRFFTLQEHFQEKAKSKSANVATTEQADVFPFTEEAERLQVVGCAECFGWIESYIQIYDKVKCLQMELDYKLVRLKKIMTCADEDVAKVCAFQDWCLLNGKGVEESMEFRRRFQNQCNLSTLKRFPRVELCHTSTSRNIKDCPDQDPDNSLQEKLPFKLTSIASFNELSCTDQCQVDFTLSTVIKEENSNDEFINDSNICDIGSPMDDYSSGNKTDPDWFEDDDDDDDEDYREKGDRKSNKSAGKLKFKTRNQVSRSKRRKREDNDKVISCQKCRLQFSSFHALHAHQKYLHTNGYAVMTKTEVSDILRLEEKNLKLEGLCTTTLNFCSDYFPACPQKFLSVDELNNHIKYHGDFTCETCSIVKNNAVDMAHHELCHLKRIQKSEDTKTSGVTIPCRKCEYSTGLEDELVNHYLESHLNKPAIQATCPICQQRFKHVEKVPMFHYINHHDLTRLEDSSSTGIQCVQEGCPAYFLTEDQLQQHWRSIHSESCALSEETLQRNVKVRTKKKTTIMRRTMKKFTNPCEFCGKSFTLESELKSHTWRFHTNEKYGNMCGQIQLTEDGLTIDEFCCSTSNKCVCSVCENIFGSQEQLDKHELHHGEFKCNFCNVVKTLATELAIHETVHNIKIKDVSSSVPVAGDYKCPRCSFTTRKRPDYVDHFLETHLSLSSDRKKCPICKKTVPDVLKAKSELKGASLKNWMIQHFMELHDKTGLDSDNISKCNLCAAYFRTPVQLDCHHREIHGKQCFECCDCGKIYNRREQLRCHRISTHKVDPATFQFMCNFNGCEHRFETQVELGYHEIGAHSGRDNEPVICSMCGKKFTGPNQLKSHMKTHVEKVKLLKTEEPFVCEQCGKSYETAQKLKKHHYKHKASENRRKRAPPSESLVCEHCGKHCENKQQLKMHRWRHKGTPLSKNFQCEVCSKRFPTRVKLTLHTRVHTKEKPYSCPLCNATFSYPQNIKPHMTAKHKDAC